MSSLVSIFIRLCIVLVGYALAILVASLFLHLLAWPSLGFEGDTPAFTAKVALVVSTLLAAVFASYYAFVPAAALIALAELRQFRSWLYHAIAGGMAGVAALVLYGISRAADSGGVADGLFRSDERSFAAALAAGIVGGAAYWAVAGRSAGRWRERREPTAPGPSGS